MASSRFSLFLTFLVALAGFLYAFPDARRIALVPIFRYAYHLLDWVQEGYLTDPQANWALKGNFAPVPRQWPFTTNLEVRNLELFCNSISSSFYIVVIGFLSMCAVVAFSFIPYFALHCLFAMSPRSLTARSPTVRFRQTSMASA
jgi:hypothetical protein